MADSSILDSTKKVLGFDPDYSAFDADITMHINAALFTLNDLGVGPDDGFLINDKTETWDQFSSDAKLLTAVKSYVYLKVRMLFDPPATSFAIDAINKQITELEWRMNVRVENQKVATVTVDPEAVIIP
jgi:hypothetical protein